MRRVLKNVFAASKTRKETRVHAYSSVQAACTNTPSA